MMIEKGFEMAIEGRCCRSVGDGKMCGKPAIAKFVQGGFSPHHLPGAFEHFRCLLHIGPPDDGHNGHNLDHMSPKMRPKGLILLDVPINLSWE